MRLLRNIFRRRLRAFLTIFGIAIGVFALVVMGAIAEKLTLLVDGGMIYYEGKVIVQGEGGIMGLGADPLRLTLRREIEEIAGVRRASAQVSGMFDEELQAVNMGSPSTYQATDGRDRGYETFLLSIAKGRDIALTDDHKVALGVDLAKQKGVDVGDWIELRDERYEVVGIYEKTMTGPDSAAVLSMRDAQEVAVDDLPSTIRLSVTPGNYASAFAVYPEKGVDPESLATRITRHIDGVAVLAPSDFREQIEQPLSVFTSVIYAVAFISLLVGGLSVINTMTMSVAERTREIGVRKAIGASDAQIMGQFVAESATMGLIGGVVGLGLGMFMASAGNAAGEASGNMVFLVTDRLMLGSLAFAVVLGTVSGLYPAYHAATLNPVEALRYE